MITITTCYCYLNLIVSSVDESVFTKKTTLSINNLNLESTKKLLKSYIWSIALYGPETWTKCGAGEEQKNKVEGSECFKKSGRGNIIPDLSIRLINLVKKDN